ncbi:3-dehydroquinate synthase [Methylovirgula ligni]|uniref:Multifunctional fusion protein n=1 Tax=Methylovirgula ligni TaxID=569860 RepID=A0A3D9Z2J0_9HYPH|nr:3-dehydroquinate synthase [Methylovirgula ligni]QAY95312.1 3-dehydroquinate synthase [Methylovirgula ligni]REF89382.1 3-dehydroquinate synthase [Methylovirgula ligni]
MTGAIKSIGEEGQSAPLTAEAAALAAALGHRSVVLVGLMGSGKSAIGRRLAQSLGLEFVDSDTEVERAADMPIPEIFARYGEPYFRDGERRVMARLLTGGPRVIATGGGAFMSEDTRARIKENGISIWLKADLDVLWRRVRKRGHRPLLHSADPEGVLKTLMEERYPIYAEADIAIISQEGPHDAVVEDLLATLQSYLGTESAEDAGVNDVREKPAIFEKVNVALGRRSYDILIGEAILPQIDAHAARLAPGAALAIVTDENVARAHLPAVEAALTAAGIRHESIVVAPGEESKSYATFEKVCDAIIAGRFERGDLVVALGGGVVGDLAGFAAASVRRGMRFIQVPTSLLAQVDSSVGGKTGINSTHGKNLIGAFHQPRLVLIDTQVLKTLPLREFRAGYAEVVKYGLINDRAFFEWLETHWRGVFAGGPDQVHAIAKSCAAKAAIVIADEHEAGERALLNLGHTFAHAFEHIVHYDNRRLVHGEAVAIGLACAFRFSAARGLVGAAEAERVVAHLRTVGLPTAIRDIPDWNADESTILEAMFQDKKVQRGVLTFILAHGIGRSFIARDVAAADVRAFLATELNAP